MKGLNGAPRNQLPKIIQKKFMQCFCVIDLYRCVFKFSSSFKQKQKLGLYNLIAFLNFYKSRCIVSQKEDYFITQLKYKIQSTLKWQLDNINISQVNKLKTLILERQKSMQNLINIISTLKCLNNEIVGKIKYLHQYLKNFKNKLEEFSQKNSQTKKCSQPHLKKYIINQGSGKSPQQPNLQKLKNKKDNLNQSELKIQKQKPIKFYPVEDTYIEKIEKLKKRYKTYQTLNQYESQNQNRNNLCNLNLNQQQKQNKNKYIVKAQILKTQFNDFHQNQTNTSTKINVKINKSKLNSTFYQSQSLFSTNSFHQSFSKAKNSFKQQNILNQIEDNHGNTKFICQQQNIVPQDKKNRIFNFLKKGVSHSIKLNSSNLQYKFNKYKGNSFILKSNDQIANNKRLSKFVPKKQKEKQTINQLFTSKLRQTQEIRKKRYKISKTMVVTLNDGNQFQNSLKQVSQNLRAQTQDIISQQKQNDQKQQTYIDKKKKNRRKGFSKKHIEDQRSSQINITGKHKKKSQIIEQNNKQERNYNRTSFFRSSGYIQKQDIQILKKSKFAKNSPFRKKQNYQQQTEKLCPKDQLILERNNNFLNLLKGKKNGLKQNELKICQNISPQDIYKLRKQITEQDKILCQQKYANYINDLMKCKYATHQNQMYINNQQYMIMNLNKKLRVMESQMEHRSNHKCENWHLQNVQCIGFGQKIIKANNQLGQKQIFKQKYNLEFLDLKEQFI